jgi:hypothetical protein
MLSLIRTTHTIRLLSRKPIDASQNTIRIKHNLVHLGKQSDTLAKQISAIQKKKTQTSKLIKRHLRKLS